MTTTTTSAAADTPVRRRGARGWIAVGGIMIVGVLAATVVVQRGNPEPATGGAELSSTQTTQLESIEVSVTPITVADGRVAFQVALDTHTGSLDADLQRSTLTTDLGTAGAAVWSGAAPGGHHREGELSFTVTGTPTEFTLDLGGLPAPVQFSWPAQGGAP
ncbi:MAG: hypothetical protein KGN38_04980 [Actinomycetales bacterium]|nr:hypothetical protein [Actinomycetales bacterium]